MQAERLPRDVLEAMSREGYAERFPSGRRAAAPTNVHPTLQILGAGGVLCVPYGGIGYELGFVSFEDGIRLVAAKAKIEELTDEDTTPETLATYVEGMRVVVSMAPRYLVPVSRWRRLLWPLTRNPFRSATDAEVGLLLGFFLGSRMRSRVRSATPEAKPARVPTS